MKSKFDPKSPAHLAMLAKNREWKACPFCEKGSAYTNHSRHVNGCYLNPKNLKPCAVCGAPLKGYKWATTCGHICRAKHEPFTRQRIATRISNTKEPSGYRTICFYFHGKQCIICREFKIVSVHHINENHKDNRPENLIPLCPTHHQYLHSKYASEIMPQVEQFVQNFLISDLRRFKNTT